MQGNDNPKVQVVVGNPSNPTVIREAAVLTGEYVATAGIRASGNNLRMLVDFTISGDAVAAGAIIAYLQSANTTTPIESDWVRAYQLLTQTAATDSVTTIAGAMQVIPVRAKLYPIEIEYAIRVTADPAVKVRIPVDLGYGGHYRLQVRAAGSTGISSAAAASTLPTVAISVSLQ